MITAKNIRFPILLVLIFVLLLLAGSAVHAETELETAVRLATEAIAEIPHVSMLRLSDKPTVENARYLVGRAKHEHGAVDADFENLDWLVAAEQVIAELEREDPEEDDKQRAIELAEEAISNLPHASMIRLTDKPDVEQARYLVGRAKHEHGAVDADFENLDWLVAAEKAIADLEKPDPKPDPDPEEEDKAWAIKLVNEAIAALPDPAAITLADREEVENVRYLVGRAKHEHGAVDSDFDNLAKLEAAERRIKELEAGEAPGMPTWVYLVLGALVILVVILVLILVTGSRRSK